MTVHPLSSVPKQQPERGTTSFYGKWEQRRKERQEIVQSIAQDLGNFLPSRQIPRNNTAALLRCAATLLFDDPQELQALRSEGDRLLFVHSKLQALHIQGEAYKESFETNSPIALTQAALIVDKIKRNGLNLELEAKMNAYDESLDSDVEKITQALNNLNFSPSEKPSNFHVLLQYCNGASQVQIVHKNDNLALEPVPASDKTCYPSVNHSGSTDRSTTLVSKNEKKDQKVTAEGLFIAYLQKKGVPFLPKVSGVGVGSITMKKYDCDLSCTNKRFRHSNFRLVGHRIGLCLAAVHELDCFHGDVKDKNILTKSGKEVEIVLTDFGNGGKLNGKPFVTGHRTTPNVIPYETFFEGKYSKKSDVFELGQTILQLIFRTLPGYEYLPNSCMKYELDIYRAAALSEVPGISSSELQKLIESYLEDNAVFSNDRFTRLLYSELFLSDQEVWSIIAWCNDRLRFPEARNHFRYLSWRNALPEEVPLYHYVKQVANGAKLESVKKQWRTSRKGRDFTQAIEHFFERTTPHPWNKIFPTLYRSVHPNQDYRPTAKEFAEAFAPKNIGEANK